MKKKFNVFRKVLSATLSLCLVFACFAVPSQGANSITSFGSSGLYFWKWYKATDRQSLLNDTALVGTSSEANHNYLYRILVCGNKPGTSDYFYIGKRIFSSGQMKCAGNVDYKYALDTTRDVFMTTSNLSTPVKMGKLYCKRLRQYL